MNLNNSPTLQQQKTLFAACDDNAGHHLLWVSKNGDVQISLIPSHLTPVGFVKQTPQLQVQYETFVEGNDYVGPGAANDNDFMQRIYNSLIKEWPSAKAKTDPVYIDMY